MLTCSLHIHDVIVKVRKFLFNYNIREFNYGFPFQLCLKIPDNKIWGNTGTRLSSCGVFGP